MSNVVYPDKFAWPLRLLGVRWRDGKRAYRMKWGELGFRPGIAFDLCKFEEHFSFHVGAFRTQVYIRLPFLQRWHREPYEAMEEWGASTFEGALHMHWGRRTKIWTFPWRDWVQTSHDVRKVDGSWEPYVGSWEQERGSDSRHLETFPYRYLLSSGEWQDRTATIYVERRRWKLRWLKRLPFARTSHAISVEFSDEVGERSGSWKGGVIGCGYDLRPNETPGECLRRMERERQFT